MAAIVCPKKLYGTVERQKQKNIDNAVIFRQNFHLMYKRNLKRG